MLDISADGLMAERRGRSGGETLKKQGTVVAAEAWLEALIHELPTFHAQVEKCE